ncbi:MAG: hypothetical protein QOE93_568 [Actinomycetota bacterium]|nr:hypothetical protein [Actinomycetota bacterium]
MVVRRSLLFGLAFAFGYRAAYLFVDTIGRATLRFPWRESPGMLAGGATSAVREHLTDPVREKVADIRAAVDEGKEAARQREAELRAENNLRSLGSG